MILVLKIKPSESSLGTGMKFENAFLHESAFKFDINSNL
jgi:hypothetical protein